MSKRTGWYVDQVTDDDDGPTGMWGATLQLDGHVASFAHGPWFHTEAAALDFLRDEVIGQTLHPLQET